MLRRHCARLLCSVVASPMQGRHRKGILVCLLAGVGCKGPTRFLASVCSFLHLRLLHIFYCSRDMCEVDDLLLTRCSPPRQEVKRPPLSWPRQQPLSQSRLTHAYLNHGHRRMLLEALRFSCLFCLFLISHILSVFFLKLTEKFLKSKSS